MLCAFLACATRSLNDVCSFLVLLQRQKSTYTAHPKAEPTPLASSAPPAGSLYSSPVVSFVSQADFTREVLLVWGFVVGVQRTPREAPARETLPFMY